MRLGMAFGNTLEQGQITDDNLRFAAQLGVTDLVAHLPLEETFPSTRDGVWSYEDLRRLRQRVEQQGLRLAAIENFAPSHWDQILLDGPGRDAQMENLKQTIRNMGRAGIGIMGYYFSLAGVWGQRRGPFARGGAETVVYDVAQIPTQTPIPHGEVWGVRVPTRSPAGNIGTVTHEQMWARLTYFLEHLVPAAAEAGVRLAAHPDDPPVAVLRETARLITHPDHYRRLLDIVPSPFNGLEFCQGTVAEMAGSDVYSTIRRYASEQRICYVHFRNVRGKVPHYEETFLDDGDVDMIECLRIYKECGFDGFFIPDHSPGVTCAAPWHASFAYAIGYLRAALRSL